MDQQWNSNQDAAGSNRQPRYAPQTVPSHQYTPRDMNPNPAIKQESYIKQEPYIKQEGYAQPPLTDRTPTLPMVSPGLPPGRGAEYNGDGDGDVNMEDVDQYGRPRQGNRGHARLPSTQLAQEESTAARRYSPMNLTPSSPYAATPQQANYQSYTPAAQSRASPTRSNSYMAANNHYYASPPGMYTRSQILAS